MSAGSARLFVALELPTDVVSELVAWRSEALAGLDGLRLLPTESLHVTLCFLGPVELSVVDEVCDACAVADGVLAPAPALRLAGLVWLPPRRPTVVAVRLKDGDGTLDELQGALAGALAAGGWYEPESRPYLPHVTIARAHRRTRIRVPAFVAPPPDLAFRTDRVTVFRSHPGSRYEPLRAIRLG